MYTNLLTNCVILLLCNCRIRKLHALLSAHAQRLDNLHSLSTTVTTPTQRTQHTADSATVTTTTAVTATVPATPTTTTTTTLHPPMALVCPPPALCTDNGLMVAWTAIEKLTRGISDAIEDQEATPRWPIGTPLSVQDKAIMTQLKKLQIEKSKKLLRKCYKTV